MIREQTCRASSASGKFLAVPFEIQKQEDICSQDALKGFCYHNSEKKVQ